RSLTRGRKCNRAKGIRDRFRGICYGTIPGRRNGRSRRNAARPAETRLSVLRQKRGAHICALSPCGRGHPLRFNSENWVRGKAATPHPTVIVERQVPPSPATGEGTSISAE